VDGARAVPSVHESVWIENLGQWDTPARFVDELGDTLVRVEPGVLWLQRGGTAQDSTAVLLELSFEGANSDVAVTPGSFDPTYNGGQLEGVAVSLDLIPSGVSLVGASTPGCRGDVMLQTDRVPRAGSANFALLCSNAPPNAAGWLLLGRKPLAQPVLFAGSTLWLAPSTRATRIPIVSDADGYLRAPISLATLASGSWLAAQAIFRNPIACPDPGLTSASNAVVIVVQ
jgi:hypothetical protein